MNHLHPHPITPPPPPPPFPSLSYLLFLSVLEDHNHPLTKILQTPLTPPHQIKNSTNPSSLPPPSAAVKIHSSSPLHVPPVDSLLEYLTRGVSGIINGRGKLDLLLGV